MAINPVTNLTAQQIAPKTFVFTWDNQPTSPFYVIDVWIASLGQWRMIGSTNSGTYYQLSTTNPSFPSPYGSFILSVYATEDAGYQDPVYFGGQPPANSGRMSFSSTPIYLATPQNVVANRVGGTRGIVVTWNAVAGANQYLVTAVSTSHGTVTQTVSSTNAVLTGLAYDTYSVTVIAQDTADPYTASPASSPVQVILQPAVIQNVTLSYNSGEQAISIAWDEDIPSHHYLIHYTNQYGVWNGTGLIPLDSGNTPQNSGFIVLDAEAGSPRQVNLYGGILQQPYWFRLESVDEMNQHTNDISVGVNITPAQGGSTPGATLPVPQNVQAQITQSTKQITLAWE